MRVLRGWLARLAGLLGRTRPDSELAAELESHISMQAEENQRRGMNRDEARRQAMIKLGGLAQAKESYRDQEGVPVLERLLQDMRYGLRMMRANPGFTLVAVITLALGIGANTAIFSIVNGVLLRPLPYEDPSRLVAVFDRAWSHARFEASPPDFRALREQNHTLDGLSAFYNENFNLTGTDHPERVKAAVVSADYFTTLGVKPMFGRAFLPGEEKWGAHRVMIVSEGFWRSHLNSNPNFSGYILYLDSEPYQIIGVLPANFYTSSPDRQFWVPMAWKPKDNNDSHNNYFVNMIGRLKTGVTQEQASSDLNSIMLAIAEKYPENKGIGVGLQPLHEDLVGQARPALILLLSAVCLVLLISCVNLANLLFARATRRQREIGIRSALGASRRRLLQQFMTESFLMALLGGSTGMALAYFSLKLLPLAGNVLPRIQQVHIDGWVLLFTAAISLVTAVLFGLLPALESSRDRKVNQSLKEGSRTSASGSGTRRIRDGLVTGEVALALVLLIVSGLALRSLQRLLKVDPGFTPEHVLTFSISFPQSYDPQPDPTRIGAPPPMVAFYREAQARIEQLPGVKAVGASSGLPLKGENWGKTLTLLDRPLPTSIDKVDDILYRAVSGNYFQALNVRLLKGRFFDEHDQATSPYVVVVNETFARKYWPAQDPIGKKLQLNPPLNLIPKELVPPGFQFQTFTVVGVVGNVHYTGLDHDPGPLVYASVFQHDFPMHCSFVVRSDLDPAALTSSVRKVISGIDKDLPLADVATMEEIMSTSAAQPRLQTILLGIFGALAMLLAAVGIYGVMSYSVSQRTSEIGVRMALGADRSDVLAMICKQGLRLAAIGLAIGLALALVATRLMSKLLFGVSPTDPLTFAAIIVLLALVALFACYVPARRATKVDPMVALRYE